MKSISPGKGETEILARVFAVSTFIRQGNLPNSTRGKLGRGTPGADKAWWNVIKIEIP